MTNPAVFYDVKLSFSSFLSPPFCTQPVLHSLWYVWAEQIQEPVGALLQVGHTNMNNKPFAGQIFKLSKLTLYISFSYLL